ncbi:MAG TPA: Ig-like domain-containing protein, partial [Methylomirabilota bacterium]|nr:Ig-like domain-containing protein [Methylomirabilota bacterium]
MHTTIHRLHVTIALLAALLIVFSTQAETVLLPTGATWKYLVTPAAPSASWINPLFDDTSGASGASELGYGDGDETTTIGFGPDTNNKYPTTYFRRSFAVSQPDIFGSLVLTLTYDDGAIVYINGVEVYRVNLPAGPVSYATYATAASDYSPAIVNLPSSALVAGNNVVAVEVHQGNATSSDVSMNLSLSGNQQPLASLTTPANGAVFAVPVSINLTVNASDPDGTIAQVDYYYQGLNPIGSSFASPFSVLWTNASEGAYSLTAVATDNTGGTGTSAPVNITVVDANPPVLVSAFGTSNTVTMTYSKRVSPSTGTNTANYGLNNGVTVLGASYGLSSNIVVLVTSPLVEGIDYTLTVNNVQDLNGNVILPDSQIVFRRVSFIPADIGNPAIAGSVVFSGDDVAVSGAGGDIGGTGDQFTFAYQQIAGNFDLKVRVDSLGVTDPWAKAALMARNTLASNSVFAASVAAPIISGSFFQSRTTVGAVATSVGSFPANYPDAWLRLKRTNNLFIGYASADGVNWVQLGSVTLNIGSVYLGLGVTSHDVTRTTTAEFRDYLAVEANATVIPSVSFASEQLSA